MLFLELVSRIQIGLNCWDKSLRLVSQNLRGTSPCNHRNYNLGQNKKEQLTPFPPKAMMKARRSKNAPFWHHWNGGRGGPDVPVILSKIVVSSWTRFSDFYSCFWKYMSYWVGRESGYLRFGVSLESITRLAVSTRAVTQACQGQSSPTLVSSRANSPPVKRSEKDYGDEDAVCQTR